MRYLQILQWCFVLIMIISIIPLTIGVFVLEKPILVTLSACFVLLGLIGNAYCAILKLRNK